MSGLKGGLENPLIQIVLNEQYYQAYGLNSGIDTNHPFAEALYRPLEDVNACMPLYDFINRYNKYAEQFAKWGYNLDWFLSAPRHLTDKLFEQAASVAGTNIAIADNIERDLRKQAAKIPKPPPRNLKRSGQ